MTHLTPREIATEQADMRYALDEMMEEYVGIRRALLEDDLRRLLDSTPAEFDELVRTSSNEERANFAELVADPQARHHFCARIVTVLDAREMGVETEFAIKEGTIKIRVAKDKSTRG